MGPGLVLLRKSPLTYEVLRSAYNGLRVLAEPLLVPGACRVPVTPTLLQCLSPVVGTALSGGLQSHAYSPDTHTGQSVGLTCAMVVTPPGRPLSTQCNSGGMPGFPFPYMPTPHFSHWRETCPPPTPAVNICDGEPGGPVPEWSYFSRLL